MKKVRIYGAWIIVYGNGTEEILTAVPATSEDKAKDILEKQGHIVVAVYLHENQEWAKTFYNL
jgi:predicted phosphoribosyltransferase